MPDIDKVVEQAALDGIPSRLTSLEIKMTNLEKLTKEILERMTKLQEIFGGSE